MSYFAEMTADKIRDNLARRIRENEAELDALQGVTINTTHKTLTNRAITGDGASLGDYIGLGKALYVRYAVQYADGHTKYENRDVPAYTYQNADGTEIGTDGILRISRTMTPAELADTLGYVIQGIADNLTKLRAEYEQADSIARERAELVERIKQFNDGLSYAGGAQI